MQFVTYVRDAVRPGGTPSRYLVWVQIVLLSQTLASVLPSQAFWTSGIQLPQWVLIGVVAIIICTSFFKQEHAKILAAYSLYVVGLIVSTITIATGITSLSGIVFMLTWAMTLFIAERREYFSFDLVTVFMVLMLASTVILLSFNPLNGVSQNWIVLYVGAFITVVDIYLIYVDFGAHRNYYQESRKSFANLDILSSKLSEVLSKQGELEDILWNVSQECLPFLELEECAIYLYNEETNDLRQVQPGHDPDSKEPIERASVHLKVDEGSVGKAFQSKNYVLVEEAKMMTVSNSDNLIRSSELAVPISSGGKVIGVIDSKYSIAGYFKERHIQAFHIMAAFCGIKITEYNAREAMRKAEFAQMETHRYMELDQMKNRFITNISHDLKTPLSLIKAPAMQIDGLSDDPRIKRNASYILKNTEHLLRVVGQLLQLNRVERGLNELYIEEVDVHALILKIGTQYQGLAEKEGIQLECKAAPIKLLTDAFRLEQIIHNLVHNAFRYIGTGNRIALTGTTDEKDLVIQVEDNGPGISAELQKKVFDRFFKADENNHEGTGIGLSLVKEYAQRLGGSVEIESRANEGSIFTVRVPLQTAEIKEEKAVSEILHDSEGKPLMLVVEDHVDLNDFICSSFEDRYQCIAAFDGAEALKLMEKQIPDIIISDLMMPEMPGDEFVRHVKNNEAFEHIPVVVLSAKSQLESRVELYELGADNYLFKPFDISELNAVVNGIVEQRNKLRKRLHSHVWGDIVQKPTEEEMGSTQSNVQQVFIEKVRSFVLENIESTTIAIPEMAASLGIGRNKFQKMMREITGLSPVEFVRSIRLLEAKRMLESQALTVSEVAYSVGFNNLSYFTRSFKNEFNALPSELQNAHSAE